jgi:parallel beta-helix repeat protein
LFAAHNVRVLHNTFRHNPGPGIHVGGSNGNLIKGNVIARNSPGILVEGDRNEVRRNRCDRNDDCVLVGEGNRNVIARNRIHKGGDGVGIENGNRNLVARNEIVGPGKVGVYLAIRHPPVGGASNVVRRNLVRGSRRDGFRVRKADRQSLLERNIAIGAEDDGFRVNSRSAKLTGNQAKRNGDLGIEAIRGVIDRGGNVARRNGDPRQCTHIACS